jgi:hypothetical protein
MGPPHPPHSGTLNRFVSAQEGYDVEDSGLGPPLQWDPLLAYIHAALPVPAIFILYWGAQHGSTYVLYVYLAPICAGGVGFLGSRIIGPRDGTPCEFFCLSIDDLTSLSPSLNQNVLGCPGNHIFPPLSSSSSSSPSRSSHTTYLSSFRFILHPPPPPPAHPPTGPDLLLDSLG